MTHQELEQTLHETKSFEEKYCRMWHASQQELASAKLENVCTFCSGSGIKADSEPCFCAGTGKNYVAAQALYDRLLVVERQLAVNKIEIDQCRRHFALYGY